MSVCTYIHTHTSGSSTLLFKLYNVKQYYTYSKSSFGCRNAALEILWLDVSTFSMTFCLLYILCYLIVCMQILIWNHGNLFELTIIVCYCKMVGAVKDSLILSFGPSIHVYLICSVQSYGHSDNSVCFGYYMSM